MRWNGGWASLRAKSAVGTMKYVDIRSAFYSGGTSSLTAGQGQSSYCSATCSVNLPTQNRVIGLLINAVRGKRQAVVTGDQRPDEAARTDDNMSIAVAHYSTDKIPPDERHSAWAARSFPSVAAMFESAPVGSFQTSADRVELDGLLLQYAQGGERTLDRSATRPGADGIDMLGVNVQFDGEITGTADAANFRVAAGGLLFLDMARSSRIALPAGRSIQLGIPRAIAEGQLGQIGTLHGVTVAPDRSEMLVSHLIHVRENLSSLRVGQEPRLARTVLDMLALALNRPGVADRKILESASGRLAAAARHEIETQLETPGLSVAALCDRLGTSRSVLYRLFKADKGVEAYIRRRRLEMVRASLADSSNAERIGELAYRWGFADASHLSRQFREAYGVTPRAYRARHTQAPQSRDISQ